MGKTNALRDEALVRHVVSTVPAANATYDVDLPAGCYYLALAVKSAVTGTTTTVAVTPFVDNAQSQLASLALRQAEPDDTAVVALLTLPAGAAGRYSTLLPTAASTPIGVPVAVPHGLRVSVTKGTAVEGETLEVDLIAVRV